MRRCLRRTGEDYLGSRAFGFHKSSTVCPYAGTGTGLSIGSAAQAAGRLEEARANYEAAARYPTAYYGQLARASSGWATWYCMSPPNLVGANGPTSRCRCSPTGSRDSLAIRLAHRHTDPLPDCVEFGVADMERIMRAHAVGGAPPNSLFTGLPVPLFWSWVDADKVKAHEFQVRGRGKT